MRCVDGACVLSLDVIHSAANLGGRLEVYKPSFIV